MSTPHDLEGLGALVTGGGSGIGLACAVRLANDGATVTICGRSEERLRNAIDATGAIDGPGSLHAIVADVSDEAAVVAAVAAAESHVGGPLGAVVANAGGTQSVGPVTHLDQAGWDATIAVNLNGTLFALKHGAASMVRRGGGSFVAVSSIAGSLPHPWFGAYGPAKAAIDQLCRQAADELGASQVRVNSVCPGIIDTELMEYIVAGGPVLDSYLANTPLGRIGVPDDIAAAVRFLVGPETTWLTGQCIAIDGGQSLRRGPDLSSAIEGLFNPEALRGVVPTDS